MYAVIKLTFGDLEHFFFHETCEFYLFSNEIDQITYLLS